MWIIKEQYSLPSIQPKKVVQNMFTSLSITYIHEAAKHGEVELFYVTINTQLTDIFTNMSILLPYISFGKTWEDHYVIGGKMW